MTGIHNPRFLLRSQITGNGRRNPLSTAPRHVSSREPTRLTCPPHLLASPTSHRSTSLFFYLILSSSFHLFLIISPHQRLTCPPHISFALPAYHQSTSHFFAYPFTLTSSIHHPAANTKALPKNTAFLTITTSVWNLSFLWVTCHLTLPAPYPNGTCPPKPIIDSQLYLSFTLPTSSMSTELTLGSPDSIILPLPPPRPT